LHLRACFSCVVTPVVHKKPPYKAHPFPGAF
jgi:hypothetical protein